jgi:rod shape-determining protein MreC
MPKERPLVSKIFSLAVFILLEIASLLMLSNNSELQKLWLARISHGFMAKTWGTTQAIGNYFSLKGQNDELALENERLRAVVRGYEQAYHDADPSSRPFDGDNGFHYIPATIVKSATNTQHNYLILDKGSDDGVVENSGVISPKGVIGIVDAVSKHYSFAISFLNKEVNISARLDTSGAVGPLAWDGKSTSGAVLKEIPLQFKYDGVADGNSITVKAGKKWIAAEYDSEPREIILIADKLPETGETITIQIVDEAKHKVSYDVTIPGM